MWFGELGWVRELPVKLMIWGGGYRPLCQMVKVAPAAVGEVLDALIRTGWGLELYLLVLWAN